MEAICEQVDNEEFVADISCEFHSKLALTPAAKVFRQRCTQLRLSQRLQLLEKHTWSGYMYILAYCGRETVSVHYSNIVDPSIT